MKSLLKVPPQVEEITHIREASICQLKSPRGILQVHIPNGVQLYFDIDTRNLKISHERGVEVHMKSKWKKRIKALISTTHSNLSRALQGLSVGFQISLHLIGVGYRAELDGGNLRLKLGFSHEIQVEGSKEIEFQVPKPDQILLRGSSYPALKQKAAAIRALRPPEPYKGKGVFYLGEQIRRKEGKKN